MLPRQSVSGALGDGSSRARVGADQLLRDGVGGQHPRREGEVLRQLAAHLLAGEASEALASFFRRRVAAVGEEALRRVTDLEGRERLEAVAELLSEEGFMARVREGDDGRSRLVLHHCPLRELVEATRLPCRAELGWVGEAVGAPLERESWMPEGDRTCAYAVGRPAAPEETDGS